MLAEYAIQNVKGIKESFDNAASNKIMEYKDANLFNMVTTSEVTEIFTSTEGMTGSKELGELETPPVLTLEDGYSVTLTEKRFGGAIILSESEYKRYDGDSSVKVAQFLERKRNQLLLEVTNYFLVETHKLYNEAFVSTDYLAPDGAVMAGVHTWKSGGTFNNSITAVLLESAIDSAMEYAGAFTDPSGKPMPLNFTTLVVKKGSAAHREAIRIFASGINPTAVADVNIYEGGSFKIIATPYISYANRLNWFLIDESLENPLYVGIGMLPQLNSPIVESNEAIRSNCTGFFKLGISNMPYAIFGSTGAA